MPANAPMAKTNVLVSHLDDEVVVYDLDTDRAVTLNSTAAAVWERCDGKTSVDRLAALLGEHFGSTASSELVELTLAELAAQGLLDDAGSWSGSRGVSRRDAIRRIGLTTAIAVPIVVGIASPAAAVSASGLPNGTSRTCTNTAPGCVEILKSPQIFRCPDSACASGFCAIQTPNSLGNCAA